jgi:UDP-hydrolysing UDP-N-acetyl-D-glucosamine 2-epimerase
MKGIDKNTPEQKRKTGPKRKIAVYTGNRSDYGLQYPILKALAADPRLEYYLLVSGAHLKKEFGSTLQEIKADGFQVYTQINIDYKEDTLFSTAQAIGSGVLGLSKVLAEMKPDFLVVYGDRFESFSAVIAGTQMGIPTAHIEGGDYTEGGALDDSVRHAMTKLSHLHFTTNSQAAERVLRMGEEPWRVFNVGLPVLDLVAARNFAAPEEVYSRLQLDPVRPIIIFTQHSVATEFDLAVEQVRPSLAALKTAMDEWYCQVVITYPSDDAGGRRIRLELEEFVKHAGNSACLNPSLGRYYYHGVLNIASAIVGNSSSGIKETPAFHLPCVNIGDRQRGRLRSDNVLDVGYEEKEISHAIDKCLHDLEFREKVKHSHNPYGTGNAGMQIAQVLATIKLDLGLVQKKMTY